MDATNRHERLVFLDRDGVINTSPGDSWVMDWADFAFAPGALDALRRLHEHGFTACVVTNQSCVARGLIGRDVIDGIHSRMSQAVADAGGRLAGVYACPHYDTDNCSCRKPKPGLIDQAVARHGGDPSRGFLVGDSARDIAAGHARGCTTLFVEGENLLPDEPPADHVVGSLAEAVDIILRLVGEGE